MKGHIQGQPVETHTRNGDPYVRAKLSVFDQTDNQFTVLLTAFDDEACAALRDMANGHGAEVAGPLTARVYQDPHDDEEAPKVAFTLKAVTVRPALVPKREIKKAPAVERPGLTESPFEPVEGGYEANPPDAEFIKYFGRDGNGPEPDEPKRATRGKRGGLTPRQLGTNPRAQGRNPRAARAPEVAKEATGTYPAELPALEPTDPNYRPPWE